MKKLVLALVCLVSVAFFASCDPDPVVTNPEPSIAILETDGYIQNGDVIDLDVDFLYGFRCASNAETQEELSRLVIICQSEAFESDFLLCDTAISGTEFVYEGSLYIEAKEIIGEAEIIATVTDAAGKFNKASIKFSINYDDSLEAVPFAWKREGSNPGEGLAELGLKWVKNVDAKEAFAVIEPVEDAILYSVPSEKWDEITTEEELDALFSDGGAASPIKDYRGVSAWSSHTYDDVIATWYDGYYYLIHITKATVTNKGTNIVIEGEWK